METIKALHSMDQELRQQNSEPKLIAITSQIFSLWSKIRNKLNDLGIVRFFIANDIGLFRFALSLLNSVIATVYYCRYDCCCLNFLGEPFERVTFTS